MISEGSCDTEDWSDDAENSALPLYQIVIMFQNIAVFAVLLIK